MSEHIRPLQEISSPKRARYTRNRGGEADGLLGVISIDRILRAVRRHRLIVIGLMALASLAALLLLHQPSLYRATAVLRLAGERRALSIGVEDAPTPDRYVTPLNSM